MATASHCTEHALDVLYRPGKLANAHREAAKCHELKKSMAREGLRPLHLVDSVDGSTPLCFRGGQVKGMQFMRNVERRMECRPGSPIVSPAKRLRQSCGPVTGGIVNMNMGTGKTLMVLAHCLASAGTTGNPSLIVTNKGLIGMWRRQVEHFFTPGSVRAMYLETVSSYAQYECSEVGEFDLVITSYNHCSSMLKKISVADVTDERKDVDFGWKCFRPGRSLLHGQAFKNGIPSVCDVPITDTWPMLYSTQWERIVCDESHRISNPQTMLCMGLASDKRWCVTGTMIKNREADLSTQLHFCGLNTLEGCNGGGTPRPLSSIHVDQRVLTIRDASDLFGSVKREKMSDSKGDKSSPKIDRRVIVVEMPPNQNRLYVILMEALRTSRYSRNVLAFVSKLRQCSVMPHLIVEWLEKTMPSFPDMYPELYAWLCDETGTACMRCPKLERLGAMVRDLPKGEKMVVFSEFSEVLRNAARRIEQVEGVSSRTIDGGKSTQDREKSLAEFKQDDSVKVLLCTYRTGSEGLLSTASEGFKCKCNM